MSMIKRFFEKKKLEIKFKTAGEGKKLTDEQVVKSTDKSKKEFFGSTSFTEEKIKAAEAAINRLNTKNDPKKGTIQNLQISPPIELPDSQINKLKVQYTCSLFENISLPKNELENKITEYLYSELSSEPEMVSLLILQTLNKNPEQIKNCSEMLEKYLSNIISHPDEEKYRKIKLSNKILQEKVIPLQGAEIFLNSVGFVVKELEVDNMREKYLVNEEKDVDKLFHAKELLQIAEPISLQLDRDCKIYKPSDQASKMPALSDDFFSITMDELKKKKVPTATLR